MRRYVFVLALLLLPLTCLPALAAPVSTAAIDTTCKYDTSLYSGCSLKVIQRPLATLPARVRPGDTLTVWAAAAPSAAGWSAALRFGALSVPLSPGGGGYSASMGMWVLGFQVPAGVAEEVYDLVLASSSTPTDTTHHSVKVLPAFRKDYYFAQITDTHLPEHNFSPNFSTCDTTGMADFDAVIDDLNYIHPEFILHTGDLVNEGTLNKLYSDFEMPRALRMLYRLHDPVFVVTGNHDVGGWTPTPVPQGSSRRDWWRFFGWTFLYDSAGVSPPAGYPYHSQMYTFDYDSLRCIGIETYLNYDNWKASLYGSGSMTTEEINWMNQQIAAAGPLHKLLFYHFDFAQGANTGSTTGPWQLNIPSLGVDGAIWGHYHSVPEDNKTSHTAHPFDLGCQSVITYRQYRMVRVHNGNISPTLMQQAGTALTKSWSGPNDGSRTRLTVAVTNSSTESWEHARVVFHMVDHDSFYAATGGTVAQTIREGGMIHVYVDCTLTGGGGVTTLSVAPTTPIPSDVGGTPFATLRLESPAPSPYRPGSGRLALRYTLPAACTVRLEVCDAAGRRVATLADGLQGPGLHAAAWDGRDAGGRAAAAGVYFVRLAAQGEERSGRVVVVR